MDYRLSLMSGVDIPIEELQIEVHQPSIREISYMGEEGFFLAVQFLSLDKSRYIKDENVLKSITNFQIFMTVLNKAENNDVKEAVINLLTLLFPKFKVLITPQSLIFNNMSEQKIITLDDKNFDVLQDVIKQVFCMNSAFMRGGEDYRPVGKKAQEIAEKLRRGREKIAAMKGQTSESVFTRYVSILTVGLQSMSLQNCLDLTVYQIFDLIERYQLYLSWDIDIRSRLAGGSSEEKPEDWMKNIHTF